MMNEKILRCQELGGDKTLSFGCMLNRKTNDGCEAIYYVLDRCTFGSRRYWISSVPFGSMDLEFDEDMISRGSGDTYEIVGHSITYGRLLYLSETSKTKNHLMNYMTMALCFKKYPEMIQQTILERPDELVDLVLSFLESLQG